LCLGLLMILSAILMNNDPAVVRSESGWFSHLFLAVVVASLFLSWAARSSYIALFCEGIGVSLFTFFGLGILSGAKVWLSLNGMALNDAVQAMQLGQAMRVDVAGFLELMERDPEVKQAVALQATRLIGTTYAIVILVYILRMIAVHTIKRMYR